MLHAWSHRRGWIQIKRKKNFVWQVAVGQFVNVRLLSFRMCFFSYWKHETSTAILLCYLKLDKTMYFFSSRDIVSNPFRVPLLKKARWEACSYSLFGFWYDFAIVLIKRSPAHGQRLKRTCWRFLLWSINEKFMELEEINGALERINLLSHILFKCRESLFEWKEIH